MADKEKSGFMNQLDMFFRRLRADRSKERDYFVENLSMLVASGMPLLSAIETLRGEIISPSLQSSLQDLEDDIEAGSPLWKALDQTELFRSHTISLVRIGEETGKLSANLKLIAVQEEKDKALRGKILGAILYPVLVLSLTAGVGIAIAWFILPRLATVFSQLNIELPLLTQYLIASGTFLEAYGVFVFPALLLVVAVVFYFVFYFPKTKFIGQYFLFSLPGVGKLLMEVEISRFGYLLGTLLNAGLPATQALDSLHVATDFPQYKKLYGHLRDSVEEGNSIQKSFTLYPKARSLIPISIVRLIGAGEQSGNLSEVLIRISDTYEQKTENTAKNLTILLEPILLVVVWGGVVMVALAVILPIYNLIGGFNDGTRRQPTTPAPSAVVTPVVPISESVSDNAPVLDDGATEAVVESTETPAEDEPSEPREQDTAIEELGVLTVLSTDLGYLNVRIEPTASSEKVGEVLPGETYPYSESRDRWHKIELEDGTYGWVSGTYVSLSPYDVSTE
jgi:type II secretory pathway component PulF